MDLVAIFVVVSGGVAFAYYSGAFDGSHTSEGYERGKYYAKCDTDYLQSAPYLSFSASSNQCECFDDKLQKLTPSQQAAAYKSLEDRLTLAFLGKAGAKVEGSNVTYNDSALGEVIANVKIETSGKAIMAQCNMF